MVYSIMLLFLSKLLMVLSFSFLLKNETNYTFVEIKLKQLVCLCCVWHDIIFLWLELDIIPFSLAFMLILPPLSTLFGLLCFLFTLAMECISMGASWQINFKVNWAELVVIKIVNISCFSYFFHMLMVNILTSKEKQIHTSAGFWTIAFSENSS